VSAAATATDALPSISHARPGEEGGPTARAGFSYQDEIAVSLLIEMLVNPAWLKVHFETHDDIVVVRQTGGTHCIAEFVQVKGGEPDKLWSVADLCAGKAGSSIFETSLRRDAFCELSRFRLVTLRPVVSELKVLTFDFGAPGREPCNARVLALASELEDRFPGIRSAKGNGSAYWLRNCLWDERHSEDAVRKDNLLRLLRLGIAEGRALLPEQAESLLDDMRASVAAASAARWEPNRDAKVVTRLDLRAWWERRSREIIEGAAAPSGGKLAAKMQETGLPDEMIALALELRRDYAAEARTPRFLELDEGERLQRRVKAELASLRARFLAGMLNLDGVGFHALCLDRLIAVSGERSAGSYDQSAFLQGCMYDIADRCLHRFTQVAR
jgi:hypothetical protein